MKKICLLSLFLLFVALPAGATDLIKLQNGDILSGKVVRKEADVLFFNTSYAGELKIAWQEIVFLEINSQATFVLTDNTTINGQTYENIAGAVRIQTTEKQQTEFIDLQKITTINPSAPSKNKREIKGRFNVGLSLTEGNSSSEKVYTEAEVTIRTDANRYQLAGLYKRMEETNTTSEENAKASFKYDHFFTPKWFMTSNVGFETDRFKDLDLRSTYGVGAGYQFWEEKKTNLSSETGLNYIVENHKISEDEDYTALRWAVNYDRLFWDDSLTFFLNYELFIGLEQTKDLLLNAKTGIIMPLRKNLDAFIKIDWDWDNTPADEKQRSDTSYVLGMGYSF